MIHKFYILVLIVLSLTGCHKPAHHPLVVSSINPRYFADGSGKTVYLTGTHTWNNLVDMTFAGNNNIFDYPAYIEFLEKYHHNFIRLWTWELLDWNTAGNRDENPRDYVIDPHAWSRTGPGTAIDGKPKFDLTKYNPEYFNRLRSRVEMAREHGIYVSIMLFEGWGIQFSPDSYRNHPFYPENNINHLGLDTANDRRLEIHELVNPKVLEIQESYLRKVIETVNDLDNVLYEISNENHPPSTAWQYHMINFIKDYEKKLGNSHPVGMTFQYRGGSNKTLFNSPADWISPNPEGGYRENPPASDGSKVILNDTDHLWGIGGTPRWVWESFLRGMNPLFMDPYDGKVLMQSFDTAWADLVRRNMGYTNDYARRVDLEHMIPMDNLASSGYCLANKGNEYLVYDPKDSVMTVDLSGFSDNFQVEWLNPYSGEKSGQPSIQGGTKISLEPPFHADFSILYLKKE